MADSLMSYAIFRDTRLKGTLPFMTDMLITNTFDASTPLADGFARIFMTAKTRGKIKTLFILCHGFGTGSGFWFHGGKGLQLGKENVTAANVSAWAAIRDCVENIVVYACGAAYTGPASMTNLQTINDGQSIMSALAKHTNAVVFASDQVQWYFTNGINFGKWEGTVYMFFPSGTAWPNFAPPEELTDVVSPLREPAYGTLSYLNYLKLKQARNR